MPGVDFPIYLVTDRHQTCGRPLLTVLSQAMEAGVRIIQVREKDLDTRALLALVREVQRAAVERTVRVLVNDRVDLALACDVAGVHLRADSLPVAESRRLLGPARLIGVSAHSVNEAVHAEADGADLVVLGPIYQTSSKQSYGAPLGLEVLNEASRQCQIPIFAIGGVTPARAQEVRRTGAAGIAVISAILAAPDVRRAVRELADAWETAA